MTRALKPSTVLCRTKLRKPWSGPHYIDDTLWYYIEDKGICTVHEETARPDAEVATSVVTLSWKILCAAVDRYGKFKRAEALAKKEGK